MYLIVTEPMRVTALVYIGFLHLRSISRPPSLSEDVFVHFCSQHTRGPIGFPYFHRKQLNKAVVRVTCASLLL